jgi:hypothetical protein
MMLSHQTQRQNQRSGKTNIPKDYIYHLCCSTQNPAEIKDTILRWCQDLTQFYKVSFKKSFFFVEVYLYS